MQPLSSWRRQRAAVLPELYYRFNDNNSYLRHAMYHGHEITQPVVLDLDLALFLGQDALSLYVHHACLIRPSLLFPNESTVSHRLSAFYAPSKSYITQPSRAQDLAEAFSECTLPRLQRTFQELGKRPA